MGLRLLNKTPGEEEDLKSGLLVLNLFCGMRWCHIL
jgi:hypothetical protein